MSGSAAKQSVEYGPQPVRCRWLTHEDEKAAPSAEVIRLIVDGSRWWDAHKINETYQRPLFRQVVESIASACKRASEPASIVHKKLIVGPAGSITTRLRCVPRTSLGGFDDCVRLVRRCCRGLEFSRSQHEFLTGIDAAIENETTPFQSVVHLKGMSKPVPATIVPKLYPTMIEKASLLGWHVCREMGSIAPFISSTRCVQTQIGSVLVFVCYDAKLVDGRGIETLPHRGPVARRIRDHFHEVAGQPAIRYVLIATHWQRLQSHPKYGKTFMRAAEFLQNTTGATVITTAFASAGQIDRVAVRKIPVLGPNRTKVVTLLVDDTYGERKQA